MRKRFNLLKRHFKKDTSLELFSDQEIFKRLVGVTLYHEGREYPIEKLIDGTFRVEGYNRYGSAVYRDLTEEVLDTLMIDEDDFYAITGGRMRSRLVVDSVTVKQLATSEIDKTSKVSEERYYGFVGRTVALMIVNGVVQKFLPDTKVVVPTKGGK